VRLFLAVDLPEPIRESLGAVIEELRREVRDVRWARPEALHITLKFLGEVEEGRVAEISDRIAEAAALAPGGSTIHLEGVRMIGDKRRPRMVWAGVREEDGALGRLQREVERACTRLGFPAESRPYTPHLTLSRLKARSATLAGAVASRARIAIGSFPVHSCALFQSHLHPQGARYVCLQEFPLGGKESGGS
jgi:2'-5' RNA ligase